MLVKGNIPLQRFRYSTSEQILNDAKLEIAPMPYPVLFHVPLKSFIDHLLFPIPSAEESNRLAAQLNSRVNLLELAFVITQVSVHCSIVRPDTTGSTSAKSAPDYMQTQRTGGVDTHIKYFKMYATAPKPTAMYTEKE